MYSIIRIVFCCVFLVISTTVVKKSKLTRKHFLYSFFIIVSVALVVALSFFPFENFFITFNSPNAVCEYYIIGESNVELIVDGNNADFVVNRKSDSNTYLIVPKVKDGWKIGIGSNSKIIAKNISNGIIVYVYQYKNTNDYFLTILDTNGGELDVQDCYNTDFIFLKKNNEFLGKSFVTYYAHVSKFDSRYVLLVNGEKVDWNQSGENQSGDGSMIEP